MVNINNKFLTLVLTAGLFFATAAVALADTVPYAQIESQSGHSMEYARVHELMSQCPVNYYVYEVFDDNNDTGTTVSVGKYQWIGSDMSKGTVKIEDANGNRVHAIITPAQYAAGQYPGGTAKATTPPTTPKAPVVATPKPTTPVVATPAKTPPSTSTATPATTTPAVEAPATTDPTQVATAEVAQTPEQINIAQAELKAKMDEAKIQIAAYRQQLGDEQVTIPDTSTTPAKKLGFWQRFKVWVASGWAKTKAIF